ncbi:chorismate mutase family protein [Microvirga calopogonii]|uniref:chorismate mutase family protein n=1 Tax=Microvirga calopogonii TaxID=2078013 RepID=UPI0013B3FA00|nr:chorismate mutase family protein [Microvirga calopogonii]
MRTPATSDPELERLRARLDACDDALMEALRERFAVCAEIAEHKRSHGLSVIQPGRVAVVRARAAAFAAGGGIDADFLQRIYGLVIDEACRLEQAIVDGGGESPGVSALACNASCIDHVAIAVRDLGAAIAMFRDQYGFYLVERRTIEGDVSGMNTATMRAGGVTFVLCEGTSPQSNVSRYIAAYGPGVQHLAIEVENQDEVLEDVKARGADLLTDIIHGPGLDQSFSRRDPNTGMQIEFVTRSANTGFDTENMRKLFSAMERDEVF